MSEFFLHMGTHKTGTTYIQRNFLHNAAALLKQDIVYPAIGLGSHWGHLGFVEAAQEGTFGEVLKEFEPKTKTLISSENFTFLTKERLEHVRDTLLGKDVHVIL